MRQSQDENLPRYCPRCGGAMVKLPGSIFYWHADTNHPPCDITNLVEPLPTEPASVDEIPLSQEGESTRGKRRKK